MGVCRSAYFVHVSHIHHIHHFFLAKKHVFRIFCTFLAPISRGCRSSLQHIGLFQHILIAYFSSQFGPFHTLLGPFLLLLSHFSAFMCHRPVSRVYWQIIFFLWSSTNFCKKIRTYHHKVSFCYIFLLLFWAKKTKYQTYVNFFKYQTYVNFFSSDHAGTACALSGHCVALRGHEYKCVSYWYRHLEQMWVLGWIAGDGAHAGASGAPVAASPHLPWNSQDWPNQVKVWLSQTIKLNANWPQMDKSQKLAQNGHFFWSNGPRKAIVKGKVQRPANTGQSGKK